MRVEDNSDTSWATHLVFWASALVTLGCLILAWIFMLSSYTNFLNPHKGLWLLLAHFIILIPFGSMLADKYGHSYPSDEEEYATLIGEWRKMWKEEPKIYEISEKKTAKDDYILLNSTILEFLHFCWLHPLRSPRDMGHFEKLKLEFGSDTNFLESPLYTRSEKFGKVDLQTIFIEILNTIANLCEIEVSKGLAVHEPAFDFLIDDEWTDPLLESEKDIDASINPNFISLGIPSIEILDMCEKRESAFNPEYEIRDISTFDHDSNPELSSNLAYTLRCCICEILNTKVSKEMAEHFGFFSPSFLTENIQTKFLETMIIEIYTICGGIKMEEELSALNRWMENVESIEDMKQNPVSSFRTRKE